MHRKLLEGCRLKFGLTEEPAIDGFPLDQQPGVEVRVETKRDRWVIETDAVGYQDSLVDTGLLHTFEWRLLDGPSIDEYAREAPPGNTEVDPDRVISPEDRNELILLHQLMIPWEYVIGVAQTGPLYEELSVRP